MMYLEYPMATLLEVKAIEGLGTTIDIVLVNGSLNEGDTIVVCGMNGPIVTTVRALLTPPPAKEIRVKAEYVHHKRVEGAMGVKIAAPDLEKAVAGTSMLVLHNDDEVEQLKEDVQEDLAGIIDNFAKSSIGVFVQASTLGSLEALMEYLRSVDPPVPVAGVNIGPIHKKHVMEASVMVERDPRFAVMLAFDVKVTPEARSMAEEMGVTIFTADIIYHLTDQFEAYMKGEKDKRRAAAAPVAVFPCVCKIIPTAVFNKKAPLVLGVDIMEGRLKMGTPLCVITGETRSGEPMVLDLGKVVSIQHNHEDQEEGKPGTSVAIKIEPNGEQRHILFGRHFDEKNLLYSHISRDSIDALKEEFRDEVTKNEWKTMVKLKKVFQVA